ncbi:MAG: S10 family peptidase [Pyrinomonadaceae bacterium]
MLAVLFFCFALVSFGQPDAQRRPPGQQPAATPQTGASPSASPGGPASGQQRGAPERPAPSPEEPPVVTKHEIRVGGRTHRYTATTGMMPIKNRDGETEARLFFMAYTLDDASNRARRPLTFSFNGGPGSSSVWLHLGTVGPKRVRMNSDGGMPAPPFELVDNEHTWLTQTDLVFIDPVGTGYSRAARPDLNAKFLGLQGDIESVGEFIRLYLTRNERWASPLFLVGESYGTTRASALSGYLIDRGIAFNGIMLVSAIMNFQTTAFAPGNDLPYTLFLPAYAATAWYHKRLPSDLLSRPLTEVVAEVEDWSLNQYTVALARGDRMSPQQRQEVAARLSRYTGLGQSFFENANLRVNLSLFRKELLRSERRSIGRLDSRFKGYDSNYSTDSPEYDASEAVIRSPYTSTFNNYVRRDLGYKTDLEYYILGGGFTSPWNWGTNNSYVDTSVALRNALAKNPYLKIFVACGYYDMATPFSAAEYTIHHISIDPSLLRNFSTGYYEAGHMMYIDEKSHAKLRADITKFIEDSLRR